MSLVNVMCSSTTPVINNNSWTVGATWKKLAVLTTKTQQSLLYPICCLKGIQCKLQSGDFSTQGWFMPHVRQILEMQELMCDSEPLNIYRQRNVRSLGLGIWTPTQSWRMTKRKRHLQIFFQRGKIVEERVKMRVNHGMLAWATDLGLGHPFGGQSMIPRLSVSIQPKCPQRNIWIVFLSHYSCSMSRCTRSFHLFRSLTQCSLEVLEYL